ncbi:EscU/YscU/HrcU family type III secretion system export apparatus switch protein [Falsirhodobacter sp. 20TX0035]|uniref:EscU/YscU/HrcU family type III secretion system export apparatus switch protein n=1 Tax=Falsirhodobacter sp. 20TX0035 TaxID=3022019 RepID=UPI00232B8D91|nr:EscU/YscU/HrcU family type III secretion system export apparatus switch protein [Falsirhodobacter sp. 20TX0035]MDB6454416.1 EscU/YscU/HrcU family type III secretion system export apparatus switch protein [Falsirhodobacter sp. 20TX0035]
MSGTSEEKTLAASDKKLRDARQKGQTAKSQDLVTGMVLLVAVIFLGFSMADQQVKVEALLQMVARRAWTEPLAALWPEIRLRAAEILLGLAVPLLAVTAATMIATNLAVMKGFVFAVEPLTPKFEKISPVEGAKRIFSMRSLVEFLKALFKISVLATAFVLVFRAGLQPLMQSSTCGASCVRASVEGLLRPLIVTAIVIFLFVGTFDVLVQNWLFKRDMKMTKSEQKRERKDSEGDPAIQQQRRKQRREMHAHGTRTGIARASMMVGVGDGWAVGIRYVRGETAVPMVVCRAGPEAAAAMLAEAGTLRMPVIADGPLAAAIARAARTGEPVPPATFQPVADLLVAARLI